MVFICLFIYLSLFELSLVFKKILSTVSIYIYIYIPYIGVLVINFKCLVVHSHLTPIPPLPTWTNNIVKKNGSHYTLSIISYIIGSSKQEWDRSGMRVYNQAFLFHIFLIYFTVIICSSFCGTIKIYI
jgi:hypothetical protein